MTIDVDLSGIIVPKLETLTTARLELRPQCLEDAELLFNLFGDEELYHFIKRTPPLSLKEFKEGLIFLQGRLSRDQSEFWINWVAHLKNTREIVTQIEVTMNRETKVAWLAYTTFRNYQGNGYAKESCLAVIHHFFEKWGTTKVIIEMDVRNHASIKLAESLGATKVCLIPKAQWLKGAWSDEFRYEIYNPFCPLMS